MQNHNIVLLPHELLQFKQLEQIRLTLNEEINEIVELRIDHYEKRMNYRTNWRTYIFTLQTSLFLNRHKNESFFRHLEETREKIENYLGHKPQVGDLVKEFPALSKVNIDRDLIGQLMFKPRFFSNIKLT